MHVDQCIRCESSFAAIFVWKYLDPYVCRLCIQFLLEDWHRPKTPPPPVLTNKFSLSSLNGTFRHLLKRMNGTRFDKLTELIEN